MKRSPILLGLIGFVLAFGIGAFFVSKNQANNDEQRLRQLARKNSYPEDDYVALDAITDHWAGKNFTQKDLDSYFRMLRVNDKSTAQRFFRFKCMSRAHALKGTPYQATAIAEINRVLAFERENFNEEIEAARYLAYSTLRDLGDPSWKTSVRADLATAKTEQAKDYFSQMLAGKM
jgi:hypothetical protein